MKLVGVDYGRRRIGMAVTDETGTLVRGLDVVDRQREKDPVGAVCARAAQHGADALVVGLPLGSDEQETVMSAEARAFAAAAAERSGLAVRFVEESYSTKNAHTLLRDRTRKRRRDKALHDRMAACLILQQYLREHP